jgi:ferredoxin
MADPTIRLPESVPGPWYVDDTCTPCHVCLDEAGPQTDFPLLRYNDDESKVLFTKQPATPEELDAAQRALEICPQNAIGSDG